MNPEAHPQKNPNSILLCQLQLTGWTEVPTEAGSVTGQTVVTTGHAQ